VTLPRIGRLPAALPSYNIYPCAEIIRSLRRLPANYERIKTRARRLFPACANCCGGPAGRKSDGRPLGGRSS